MKEQHFRNYGSIRDPCRWRRYRSGIRWPGSGFRVDRRRMESRRKNRVYTHRTTLFGLHGCVFVGIVTSRSAGQVEKTGEGIAFTDGSFPQSKLLGCHSNWPGNEQSALLPDICQQCAAALRFSCYLFLSLSLSLFSTLYIYEGGHDLCRYLPAEKGHRPLWRPNFYV